MQKALLIAEKPDLMRKIKAVYDSNKSVIPYEVTFLAQSGHLVTLKKPDEIDEEQKVWKWENLPFYPEEHGGWQYKVIQEKKVGHFPTPQERYEEIKDELKSGDYDFVIHAGDPDQEGELLIHLVLSKLKNTLPIKRFWTNDVTPKAILDALLNLKDDDHDPILVNLLKAGYCRQHEDYLFGMNISEAASLKMHARVACGRVKDVILAIVCIRDAEIKNFVPKTVYGVKVVYDKGFEGQLFDATKVTEEDKSDKDDEKNTSFVYFDTEKEALDFISTLDKNLIVEEYTTKRVETYAPKLFKLATAQVAAGKLGYSPSDTLAIIQSLYEKTYVSYPRTDCEYLSSKEDFNGILSAVMTDSEFEPYIKTISKSTIEKVRATKKWINDKALTESGHSALRPTTTKPDYSSMSADEIAIYKLICRQFVAIFLPPLVQDKTALVTSVDGNTFKTTGKTLVSEGYTKIFGTKFTDVDIPKCTKGDILTASSYEVTNKTSTCPKLFSEPDLIAVCEAPHKYLNDPRLKALGKKLKIGTPATRSGIIKRLIEKDKYLAYDSGKKHVIPTGMGLNIYENLKNCDICKVDVTGEMEEKLEMVRMGTLSQENMERQTKELVEKMLAHIKDTPMTPLTTTRTASTIMTCPRCGKDVISSPKSFFCSGYKDGCKFGGFRNICESSLTDAEFISMTKGEIIEKKLKKDGKTWQQKLKFNMETCRVEFVKDEAVISKYTCPCCGFETKEDSRTIKCEDCGFTVWKTTCGKELSSQQIDNLMTKGDSGVIKGLKSKSGKKFDASIVVNKALRNTEFKFKER